MGASMLANYCASAGEQCPLSSMVGVSCHFDTDKAFAHVAREKFGLWDFVLGMNF
jgi:predicted alpha/beta-fold hydrolase